MGASAPALATLEVPVGGRGRALAGSELVGVHGQAHRAAGLAPVETGGGEDAVVHIDEFSPDSFEKTLAAWPKPLIQF